MAQRARRATAAAVTVVTAATVLAGCGRLENRRHAFPDSLYGPAPSASVPATASGIPSAAPSGAAESGRSPAATPGSGAGASGEPYGDLTMAQLLDKAEEAAAEVRTVRVVADLYDEGERSALDIHYDRETGDLAGSVEVAGYTVEILRRGDDAWYKGEAAYWRAAGAPADVARQIGDKYVHVPSTHAAFANLDQFEEVADPAAILATLTKPRRQTALVYRGEKQIPVEGYSSGDPATVYLSVEHGLVPVRVADSGTGSALDYRDLDKPVVVTTPPASRVVEIEDVSADVRLPTA